jgi:hypothetical protein
MPIEMRRVFEILDGDQTMSGSAVGGSRSSPTTF